MFLLSLSYFHHHHLLALYEFASFFFQVACVFLRFYCLSCVISISLLFCSFVEITADCNKSYFGVCWWVKIHLTLILCECLSSTVHQAHEQLKKPHIRILLTPSLVGFECLDDMCLTPFTNVHNFQELWRYFFSFMISVRWLVCICPSTAHNCNKSFTATPVKEISFCAAYCFTSYSNLHQLAAWEAFWTVAAILKAGSLQLSYLEHIALGLVCGTFCFINRLII